jgi:hypothetical protein
VQKTTTHRLSKRAVMLGAVLVAGAAIGITGVSLASV